MAPSKRKQPEFKSAEFVVDSDDDNPKPTPKSKPVAPPAKKSTSNKATPAAKTFKSSGSSPVRKASSARKAAPTLPKAKPIESAKTAKVASPPSSRKPAKAEIKAENGNGAMMNGSKRRKIDVSSGSGSDSSSGSGSTSDDGREASGKRVNGTSMDAGDTSSDSDSDVDSEPTSAVPAKLATSALPKAKDTSSSDDSRDDGSSDYDDGSESDATPPAKVVAKDMVPRKENSENDSSDDDDDSSVSGVEDSAKQTPKADTARKSSSTSSSDSDAGSNTASEAPTRPTFTTAAQQDGMGPRLTVPFQPPGGFTHVEASDAPDSLSRFQLAANSQQQLIYVTAPKGVSLRALKDVQWADILSGKPVLAHQGTNYAFHRGDQANTNRVMLPSSTGFKVQKQPFATTLHLQPTFTIPAPKPPSRVAVGASKRKRAQPQGLRHRFRPIGDVGLASAPDASDEEMADAPPVFRVPPPKLISGMTTAPTERQKHETAEERAARKAAKKEARRSRAANGDAVAGAEEKKEPLMARGKEREKKKEKKKKRRDRGERA